MVLESVQNCNFRRLGKLTEPACYTTEFEECSKQIVHV